MCGPTPESVRMSGRVLTFFPLFNLQKHLVEKLFSRQNISQFLEREN